MTHDDMVAIAATGEVLTRDEYDAELRRLAADLHAANLDAARLFDELSRARAAAQVAIERIRQLMTPGTAFPLGGGNHLEVELPKTKNRRLREAVIDQHAEALADLGLAPEEREVTKTVRAYPTIGALDKNAAALEQLGLSVNQLTYRPDPDPPRVRITGPSRKTLEEE